MGRVVNDVAVDDAGRNAVILGTKHCEPSGDNKSSSRERKSTSEWPRISISASLQPCTTPDIASSRLQSSQYVSPRGSVSDIVRWQGGVGRAAVCEYGSGAERRAPPNSSDPPAQSDPGWWPDSAATQDEWIRLEAVRHGRLNTAFIAIKTPAGTWCCLALHAQHPSVG